MHLLMGIGLLFISIGLTAQSAYHKSYPIGMYTVNDGLSQSSVYCITQDSLGYIWFGTGDGLTRFDGRNFHRYLHQNGDGGSLVSNTIRGIIADQAGYIWVGTDGGLEWFDPHQQRFYLAPNKELQNVSCIPLYRDSGRLIIHVEGKGVGEYRFLQDKWTWLWTMGPIPNGYFQYGIKDQRILLSYENGLLLNLDAGSLKVDSISVPADLENSIIGSLYLDEDNHINIISESQWWRQEDHGWVLEHEYELSNQVTAVFVDDTTDVFLGVEGKGIYRELAGGSMQLIWSDPRFTAGPVNCFYRDSYGHIWVGIEGIGVVCLGMGSSLFDHYSVPFLKSSFVKCLAEDSAGNWWVGYHENGVQVINPKTQNMEITNGLKPLENATIFGIKATTDGAVWLNTSFGLFRYHHEQLVRELPGPEFSGPAEAIWVGRAGKLQGNWLNQFLLTDEGEGWKQINHSMRMPIRVGEPLRNGFLCLGSDFGLYFLDPTSGQLSTGILTDRKIRSIWQSNDSILWVATTTGLGKVSFPGLQLQQWLDESSGLPNSYVYGVLGDDLGYLWISTNRGLCRLNPTDGNLRAFSVNQGLQSMEFNTKAFAKLKNGDLLFGGVGGFNVVYPGAIPDKLPDIPILLADLQWQDRTIIQVGLSDQNTTITLPYANSRLSFELQPMVWPDAETYLLSVKLEGQDKEWLRMGLNNRTSYTNLAPGDYRMWAQVQSTDGRVGKEQLLMTIHINRPWWRTVWFYGILVLSIALVAGGIVALVSREKYRKKVREAELQVARESLRVQLARDIHDDLGAGLSKIALMSELGGSDGAKRLPEIAAAARDLVGRMGEIIWAMQPDSSTWKDLVIHFRSYGAEYLEHMDILLEVAVQGAIPPVELNPGQKRNLLMIYKEALRNVQQHSKATRVNVCFYFQPEGCRLTIADNGTGQCGPKSVMRGHGFENMRERAKSMGGWCEAGPTQEAGWETIVWIPYRPHEKDTTNWGTPDMGT